jgi:hypothetical protein
MAINAGFVKAVSEGRLREVYQRISDIMPIDPSLHEQDEMLKYAEEKLPNLYQKHNGEELKAEISDWTNDYYDDERYRLEKNFSRERLNLLRDMTKHRYADTIKYRAEEENERQRQAQKQRTESAITTKQAGSAAIVVGVVAAGIGIGISSTMVTLVGAVVAVGGIVAVATDATKK